MVNLINTLKKQLRICASAAFLMLFASSANAQILNYDQALERVSVAVGDKLVASSQKSATVLDVTNLDGAATQLGRLISQDLTDKFIEKVSNISWIDRSQRDYVLRENKLAADKLMDPKTQKQLGKLIGVDTIIVGTATQLDQTIRLQVRAIDIETAKVLASSSVTFALPDSMKSLSDRTVMSAESATSSTSSSTGSASVFKNRVLSVAPRNLRLGTYRQFRNIESSNDGPDMSITLEVENVSGQDLWLGITGSGIPSCGKGLLTQTSGIQIVDFSKIPKEDNKYPERRNMLTAVPAGAKTLLVMELIRCNEITVAEKSIPVSIDLVVDHQGKVQKMSIGLAAVPITSNTRR